MRKVFIISLPRYGSPSLPWEEAEQTEQEQLLVKRVSCMLSQPTTLDRAGVTWDVCAGLPSPSAPPPPAPPGPTLVWPPLCRVRVSGPPSRSLPPGKCRAEYTEAAFSFCSWGRGRLRLRQHHVSWGSAFSEGKRLWAPQLLGVPKSGDRDSSDWLEDKGCGLVRALRKETGWMEP